MISVQNHRQLLNGNKRKKKERKKEKRKKKKEKKEKKKRRNEGMKNKTHNVKKKKQGAELPYPGSQARDSGTLWRKFLPVILYLLSFIFCFPVFSQKPEKDFIIEKIKGVKYYIHSVEKGNTLYSISKKYGVSIEDITENNPEAASGLRIGQTLKIPVSKAKQKESEPIPAVIQGDFLIHDVAAKETLYSISKKYNLKIKDIIDINPETATKDLSIGQKLKIPILRSQEVEPIDILPAVSDSLVNHTAKKGETVYTIARLYNVNVDSIFMLNAWLKDGLKENQIIRIPKLRPGLEETVLPDSVSKAAIVLKDLYNVALMLPFHYDINDSIERNLKFNEKPYIYKESEIALLFYEGAMLALDSIKKSGGAIRAYTFDTREDSLETAALLKKPEMSEMDLIIGPFYQHLFEDVAEFAKLNETGIVCPVPQSAKILLENKYASKVLASPLIQAGQLAEFVMNKYQDRQTLVFGSTDKTDMRLSQSFLQKAEEVTEKQGKNFSSAVSSFYFAEINTEKLKALLSSTDTNFIILPSYNQVFVSDMLTKLNSLLEHYNIMVFCLDKLTGYENIDVKYLHQLQVHVASPSYFDYEDQEVKRFIMMFREKYKTEPGKFGFLGFDVTYYYLSALLKYGKNFYDYLPGYKLELFSNSFDFIRTGFESGCENKHVYILKYENFKLVRAE